MCRAKDERTNEQEESLMESASAYAGEPARIGDAREHVACNACGTADCMPLFVGWDHLSSEEFRVVRCNQCGLSFVNPRPSAEDIARYYPEAYYGSRHPFLADFMMGLRARKLPPLNGAARLLDIGCGRGDFMLHCRRRGWTVAGVEQRHSPIMALKAALGIEVYEPEHLEVIPSDHFDVVTIWHVLEHVPDPARTLAHIHRVLKPAGVALIEVPNFGGWQGRLGGAGWFHLDVPRHLFHFDRASLHGLLVQQALSPYRWQTFSLEYDAFGLAQTLLNRFCSRPNHLFQMLIRRGAPGGTVRDTVISLALFPWLLALAFPASVVAAARGAGGVLRVWARKSGRGAA
jgi:2-polyprenyl-3-methyl-5-hydroxy-6-metoxy-1,4-benzoquinol methylase